MVVAGIVGSRSSGSLMLQLFLLPVAVYFVWALVKNIRSGQIDLNLEKKGARLVIFGVIFVLLLMLGIINLNKDIDESFEQTNYPESSPLIFPKQP